MDLLSRTWIVLWIALFMWLLNEWPLTTVDENLGIAAHLSYIQAAREIASQAFTAALWASVLLGAAGIVLSAAALMGLPDLTPSQLRQINWRLPVAAGMLLGLILILATSVPGNKDEPTVYFGDGSEPVYRGDPFGLQQSQGTVLQEFAHPDQRSQRYAQILDAYRHRCQQEALVPQWDIMAYFHCLDRAGVHDSTYMPSGYTAR